MDRLASLTGTTSGAVRCTCGCARLRHVDAGRGRCSGVHYEPGVDPIDGARRVVPVPCRCPRFRDREDGR